MTATTRAVRHPEVRIGHVDSVRVATPPTPVKHIQAAEGDINRLPGSGRTAKNPRGAARLAHNALERVRSGIRSRSGSAG